MMMRKNPPGTLGTGRPVTLVVTDIEVCAAHLLWLLLLDTQGAQLLPPAFPLIAIFNGCCRWFSLQDSTAMWDASPEDMNRSLAMHNSCLRDALKECYG